MIEHERPGKRRRKREMDLIWGNEEGNEVIVEWLHDMGDLKEAEHTVERTKQTKLKPWTWQKIEARKVILEIVRELEEGNQVKEKEETVHKNSVEPDKGAEEESTQVRNKE